LSTALGRGIRPAGHDWDAIQVPRSVGLTALDILGARSGAVLDEPRDTVLLWFIAPGASAAWDVPNTRAISEGGDVVIPPHRRTQGPGPHWKICPGDDAWLTDVDALRAAIEDALGGGTR
jgi:hypothetical protein